MNEDLKVIIIVGAGQSGSMVAFTLRDIGYRGKIYLIGDEIHLPYERPQLSKNILSSNDNVKFIADKKMYEEFEIELILNKKVKSTNAQLKFVTLDDKTILNYDRLVIATGVRPRTIPSLNPSFVTYLRSIEDANELKKSISNSGTIGIIGGGVIGLEVASTIRSHGKGVLLFEAGDRLMSRSVNEDISTYLDNFHRSQGTDIYYNSLLLNCDDDGFLYFSNGKSFKVDHLLVCIGVVPNNESFKNINITDEFGIKVNEYGQTSHPSIYATGDIASQPNGSDHCRIETWENAQVHAHIVAENILGANKTNDNLIWFWSDQGSLNLQVLGDINIGKKFIRDTGEEDKFCLFTLDNEGFILGCATINMPKEMSMARKFVRDNIQLDSEKLSDSNIKLKLTKKEK